MLEKIPACFSCVNNFNLLQSSLGLEDKNLVEPHFGFDFLREPVLEQTSCLILPNFHC